MNVLISQKIGVDKNGSIIDILESDYSNYFSAFNFELFPVSNFCSDLSHFFKLEIGGIILTGGNDVEEKNEYIQSRNMQENKLIDFAIEKKIPIFCICRGMQFVHYRFGGKLKSIKNHVACVHDLRLEKSALSFGKFANKASVNSYHNLTVDEDTISSDFDIFARTGDGAVEGIIHKELPIMGIQWHPERTKLPQNDEFNKKLINDFFYGRAE